MYIKPRSMAEINSEKKEFTVVSTFSGGGGSSTGYKMAGLNVVWANELIDSARETYALNHPKTILDSRDIRTLSADDILKATGLKSGELDIFDGSPPCSAFSMAGKREDGWGVKKKYSDHAVQVVDDLFFEYARLLKGLQPKVFIAENVKGLVIGAAKGYFIEITRRLKDCGYKVKASVLDASYLGVPQARERVIFIGVRDDLGIDPSFSLPFRSRPSLQDALDSCNGLYVEPETSMIKYAVGAEWRRLKIGEQSTKYFQLIRCDPRRPSPTITTTAGANSAASPTHPYECRKFSLAELRAICGFPPDYRLSGDFNQSAERLGRAVPPVMMMQIALHVKKEILGKIK